jgi:hypothetical protein
MHNFTLASPLIPSRGVIPHPLPEVNFLMVEIPTPKPYIFMIRVTRQIKCLIAQAPGVIPHPLHVPEVNFLMVEIPTLKPYIYSLFSYLFIKRILILALIQENIGILALIQENIGSGEKKGKYRKKSRKHQRCNTGVASHNHLVLFYK